MSDSDSPEVPEESLSFASKILVKGVPGVSVDEDDLFGIGGCGGIFGGVTGAT